MLTSKGRKMALLSRAMRRAKSPEEVRAIIEETRRVEEEAD